MTTNMFGIVVMGRMVDANFQQVGERQFLKIIPDADNVKHLAVFLTGQIPFPDGMAGLIYFSWPDANSPPNWQLLGCISNEKPSSVFKIASLNKKIERLDSLVQFGQGAISHNAQIGVSVEPFDEVAKQMSLLEQSKSNEVWQCLEFMHKMMENFAEFISSSSVPHGDTSVVPLHVVQNWYQVFQRRLALNAMFWKS